MYINKIVLVTVIACYTAIIFSTQKITVKDIHEIYNTCIKSNMNDEYKFRYSNLPLEKNNDFWPWKDKDLPRVIALLEFEKFVKENNISYQKGLAINGIDPEWHHLPSKEITHISYETDPIKYDLHSLNLPDKDYDFVMVNQTLEHVYDPIRCLENIYKHMSTGGILYFNVPSNTIPHDTPIHYYTGYTPVGLGVLVKLAGFKILSIGQWGNSEYLKMMHGTNSWPDYLQFAYPAVNDLEHCPVISWIFAIK